MENKKSPNFFLIMIVIIIGPVLFKQFNFEKLKFEKPAIAIVYIVVILFSVYFLIKDFKNRSKK